MKQNKIAMFCLCAFIAGFASAIEVDEAELQRSGSTDSVQFENYGGPYAVIESAQAIVGIGSALGREVAQNPNTTAAIQPYAKYSLIHVVSAPQTELLDADILVFNQNAGVDHINNVRRIVSGYIEAAYGYERNEAEAIAVFVTVYNAVYRNQLSYFEEKYSPQVFQNLNAEKVGLSTNWEHWAGNTQLVIPLSSAVDGSPVVDTSAISDEKVIEALRQEDDKNIAVREQLADIKEREASTASQNAQEAQKDATRQRQAGNTEQAAQSAQTATTQQQIADRKNNEVRTERAEIAKDLEAVEAASPAEPTHTLTGLFGTDGKGLFRLMTVDGDTGNVIMRSPVTQVRSKNVYTVQDVSISMQYETVVYQELYLAVCGVSDKHSEVRLCLIDASKLELQKQSEEVLSESTEIVPYKDEFFVVVQNGSAYAVAAYDKNLTVKKQSKVTVSASTPLNVMPQGLLVTNSSGNPELLDWGTLESVWGGGSTTVNVKTSSVEK